MKNRLVNIRKNLMARSQWLRHARFYYRQPWLAIIVFTFFQFARFFVNIALGLIEIPLHLMHSPMEGFSALSLRNDHGQYMESYTGYLRRMRISVGMAMLLAVAITSQFVALGYGLWTAGRPTAVEAYSTSSTITATYDVSSYYSDAEGVVYCYSESATTLSAGYELSSDIDKAHIQFALNAIPINATITKVEIIATVSKAFTSNKPTIIRDNDNIQSESCEERYNGPGVVTSYNTPSWTTTGAKTFDLGSSAVSDVQTRINDGDANDTDYLSITLSSTGLFGTIYSVNNASDKPQLKVSYTLPPQTPTGFAKGAITTSSIVWNWTDNATADTRYDVHSGASGGSSVTGCTNLAANIQTCTETDLTANTQYARHPNVTDANGNTDGTGTSAYTAIETPTGINFDSVTDSSITVSAAGTISNLASGSSGLYFSDTVITSNSGWLQTNTWTKSMSPNSRGGFRVQARNGDAVETSATASFDKYTLSLPVSLSNSRSTSTWYNTGAFNFTNEHGYFGAGTVQYYRYIWDHSPTHAFDGTESTWADDNAYCPSHSCTNTSNDLTQTTPTDGNNWYLHARSYNAEDVASGSGTTYGPYYFDATAPSSPAAVTESVSSGSVLNGSWTAAVDVTSGIGRYDYAIGTTAGGTDVVSWTNNGTATSVSRSDLSLTDGSTYYLSVRGVDVAGNVGVAANSSGVRINSAAPTISSFSATTTSSGATLTWTTNEPASTQIEWGTTTGYGQTTTLDSNLVTAHTVTLTGLSANTVYHARALSVDDGANTGTSADLQFTTQASAVTVITNVAVTAVSSTSVIISWTTNEPATSRVRYGTTTAYGLEISATTLTTSHSLALTGLTAATTYHFAVSSVGSTTDVTADATFFTDNAEPTATRAIIGPAIQAVVLPPTASEPVVVAGFARSGQTVKLYIDGRLFTTKKISGVAGKNKTFSINIPRTKLPAGKHTIKARTVDTRGHLSAYTKTITIYVSADSAQNVTANNTGKYIVQPGDSLWKISQQFLGQGVSYNKLVQANLGAYPDLATHPNLIQPGMVLNIPAS